ncbi:Plasmid stabilization system [sediment metagenome]|uniref:Plasmid stabilization system n=1 Tax=sediment metagenome TaxID=749907 RepID=D9PJY4_9ZZZZ
MSHINYSSKFLKNFKKLDNNLKKKAVAKIKVFENNPRNASLRTHKLSGQLDELFSFSVDYSYRIIFVFEVNGEVTLIDIGTHSIYQLVFEFAL